MESKHIKFVNNVKTHTIPLMPQHKFQTSGFSLTIDPIFFTFFLSLACKQTQRFDQRQIKILERVFCYRTTATCGRELNEKWCSMWVRAPINHASSFLLLLLRMEKMFFVTKDVTQRWLPSFLPRMRRNFFCCEEKLIEKSFLRGPRVTHLSLKVVRKINTRTLSSFPLH